MFICAAALFITAVIKSLSLHHYEYHLYSIGMRLMAALKGVVYLQVSVLCILLNCKRAFSLANIHPTNQVTLSETFLNH